MSGAKSGGVGLGACLFLAGAPVVLAVVGTAYVVGAAVRVYTDARDKIHREREQAMCEQRENVNRLVDSWKEKMAATEQSVVPPEIRTVEESFANMAAAGPVSINGSAVDELKGYISEQEIEAPAPFDDQWRKAERRKCQDVIDCMEEIVRSMTEPLPEDMARELFKLHQILDSQELSDRALNLRLEINKHNMRIAQKREQDKASAANMLENLPGDCPQDARQSFQEAAEGVSPLTDELRQLFDNLKNTQRLREVEQKEVDRKNKEIASEVLRKTLEGLGYDVSCTNNNIFSNGSEAYIRNDRWDEGYCVNLRINNDRIHFKAVKDGDTDLARDASMERAWESEFKHVTEKLNEAQIFIKDIIVGSEPGETPVLKKQNIPINTRKKASAATASEVSQNQAKMHASKGTNL